MIYQNHVEYHRCRRKVFIGDHTKQLKLPSKVLPQDTPYSMKKKLTKFVCCISIWYSYWQYWWVFYCHMGNGQNRKMVILTEFQWKISDRELKSWSFYFVLGLIFGKTRLISIVSNPIKIVVVVVVIVVVFLFSILGSILGFNIGFKIWFNIRF